MFKFILIFLLYILSLTIILFSSCSTDDGVKNDLNEMNLNGKVKSIREYSYEAVEKFGEISKGNRISEISGSDEYILFNDKGNNIERNIYNSDGNLDKKWTYKYDDKGNKIEVNGYNSDGSLDNKLTFNYDDKGNSIEVNVYNSDGSLNEKRTYKYDDKGNKIEENWYNSDSSLYMKWTYEYNDRGNMIEKNWYKSDGNLFSKTTYKHEYDKKNNWIKRIEFEKEIPKYILEREIKYFE